MNNLANEEKTAIDTSTSLVTQDGESLASMRSIFEQGYYDSAGEHQLYDEETGNPIKDATIRILTKEEEEQEAEKLGISYAEYHKHKMIEYIANIGKMKDSASARIRELTTSDEFKKAQANADKSGGK